MIGRHLAFVVLASVATLVAQASTPFGEDTWHHVVYENPTMRLFSVNVAPGMMTGMHEHQFDIVTVSMNEGTPTRVQTSSTAAPSNSEN